VSVEDWLLRLLCCPRCGADLTRHSRFFECSAPGCPYHDGKRFPSIDGQPCLIDFPNSILDEAAATTGQSPVERKRKWYGRLYASIVEAPNSTAEGNIRRLTELAKRRAAEHGAAIPVVLVVGGGSVGAGCEALYADAAVRLVSFDVYRSMNTAFLADAHAIPLKDQSVDAVIVQAVLEHVLDPTQVVAEIHRVLKANGPIYAETPFMQQVHEGAFDFTRFTESGHRWLFRRFAQIESGVAMGLGPMLFWALRYAAAGLLRNRKLARLFCMPFFWVQFVDRFVPVRYQIDGASGFYFLGEKSETALTPRQLAAYYSGAQRR
jgi:SAM-dependent methyltransferase